VPRAPLPIDDVLPELLGVLERGTMAVLQAPPGAGKTTVVPLALAGAPWAAGGRVVVLEPRRLAARAAARRMAAIHGTPLGSFVGFRVRGESRTSASTRVEIVTEGVLTRMLASDPTLDGVRAVVFDEFHERNLVADVGLALTLRTIDLVRPDLRLLVMSATLDDVRIAALLGDAPVVRSSGRAFPVEIRWTPPRGDVRPVDAAVPTTLRALGEVGGDVLVFLPGSGDIRRVAERLEAQVPAGVRVYALHGMLASDAQDAAIAPSPPGTRKVVCATSIAETSLTIEGVRAVVDSGLARVPRFDLRSGMTRLETVRVTQDAAEQRCGRAGRVAPGVCYRLWAEGDHAALLARRTPEILSADLAPLALDLALAGVDDVSALRWLDAPPAAALAAGRELLAALEAIDAQGRPTPHGERMAALGLHPRLAHLVLRAGEAGALGLGCELAALLDDRDVVAHGTAWPDPDVGIRLALLHGAHVAGVEADRGRVARVRDEAARIAERAGGRLTRGAAHDEALAADLLALAYPDRVALARPGARGGFRMRNGRGARIDEGSPLARAEALAIAVTDGERDDARVRLAAPLSLAAIERLFGTQVAQTHEIVLDDAAGAMRDVTRRLLGALVLAERSTPVRDGAAVAEAFTARVRRDGLGAFPWPESAQRLRERLAFLHAADAAWPAVDDAALLACLDAWLPSALAGVRRWDDIRGADVAGALRLLVPPAISGRLDTLAPTHLTVPTGSRIPVDYADPAAPVVRVRLQEMFGLTDTPRVGGGRVPVTLHLLSPAGRPLQVTRDLGGFWRGSYAAVRKEMRGRYPRHPWPEDPVTAEPTRRAKPRT
jgi:ATP-dependent helicase HrpB